MKQDLLTIGFFVLIVLYLLGFFFAARLVLNSQQPTIAKAALILGLLVLVALLCLATFFLLAFSTNPWAH